MKKLFILSLDGTPYSFLRKAMASGLMPNFKLLAEESQFSQMDSVIPPLSSSAWASFATGKNPAEHGIMGFTEREPAALNWYVPNAGRLKAQTLWQKLSDTGKKVFVMNVPLTYPPAKINGIMISGFLAPDLNAAAYPKEIGTLLKAHGYIIDADTELAKKDLSAFFAHLNDVLDRRTETMMHFLKTGHWDFFMTHIMETDRLHHFFWEYMENGIEPYTSMFYDFYSKIDQQIKRVLASLPADTAFMMLSDHGFTVLRKEVYLNRWLEQSGLLGFTSGSPTSLKDMHPGSTAYSLYPGRIYLNVQAREKHGWIKAGLEYEQKRAEIRKALLDWKDDNGQKIIKEIYTMNELYGRKASARDGQEILEPHPWLPDLIAVSIDGFDLKGNISSDKLFNKTVFNGMHTFNDAFVLGRGINLPDGQISIDMLFNTILSFFSPA